MAEEKFQTVTPHLVVDNGNAAIDFYRSALGAEVVARHTTPDGKKVMHAHLKVLGMSIMLSDDFPEYNNGKSKSPKALGGSAVTIHLHTDGADALWAKAVKSGAKVTMPLADQFWGDYYGKLEDPFGHEWSVGQTKKIMSQEAIEEASKQHFKI
jgi:PhnB protein